MIQYYVLSESESDLLCMAKALMDESKQMELTAENIKHMILSRGKEIELVENLKYLGVELNASGNNHKEIQNRRISSNKCFFGLNTILKSKLIIICPIALYACETYATTKTDEHNQARFNKSIL
ncbi:Reverse transcriptase domain-containing protein [Aphis craccivora]|uniref:Reverse transcriptase domain-containing protein n=1 Tax=Aphis craccivora TaxID=307492 RepID=A0A6G0YSG7_APHCR|nr:Reverse transcriptase domain-containing protein [Aphis craccivora]